jgi:hypothetical protein
MSGLELKKKGEDASPAKGPADVGAKRVVEEAEPEERNLMITLDNCIQV